MRRITALTLSAVLVALSALVMGPSAAHAQYTWDGDHYGWRCMNDDGSINYPPAADLQRFEESVSGGRQILMLYIDAAEDSNRSPLSLSRLALDNMPSVHRTVLRSLPHLEEQYAAMLDCREWLRAPHVRFTEQGPEFFRYIQPEEQ
jgi:hypothetical protein